LGAKFCHFAKKKDLKKEYSVTNSLFTKKNILQKKSGIF
jgi:hypothetical protein